MPRRRTASRRGGVDPPVPTKPGQPDIPTAFTAAAAEAERKRQEEEEDPKPIAKADLGGKKRTRRGKKGGKKTRRRGGDDRTDAQKMAPQTDAAPAPAPAAAPRPPPLTSMVTPNPYQAEDDALVSSARRNDRSGGKKTSRTYLYGGRKTKKTGGKHRRYSRRR